LVAMGRIREIRAVGLSALIAVSVVVAPAVAFAASKPPPLPELGRWASSTRMRGYVSASFVVTSDGKDLKSLTFNVTSDTVLAGCPTGLLTIPGPLELKDDPTYGSPYWGFGMLSLHTGTEQMIRVSGARLKGKPVKNVALEITFSAPGGQVLAGGEISVDPNDVKPGCAAGTDEIKPPSSKP
jgi:hypothetical protein